MTETVSVLKEIAESSSHLSAWALAVAGGTVGAIVSTSYRRPITLPSRLPYLLFVPGWMCLAASLYMGNRLAGEYLASLLVKPESSAVIASQINDTYANQWSWLLWSLAFFGCWLLVFLLFWVFGKETAKGGES